MRYEYDTALHELPKKGGVYVAFPWDLKVETGKGRMKVHAEFNGMPYDGRIVNMGLKNPDGSVCYIIGVLKSIRTQLGIHDGSTVHVVITEQAAARLTASQKTMPVSPSSALIQQ